MKAGRDRDRASDERVFAAWGARIEDIDIVLQLQHMLLCGS